MLSTSRQAQEHDGGDFDALPRPRLVPLHPDRVQLHSARVLGDPPAGSKGYYLEHIANFLAGISPFLHL